MLAFFIDGTDMTMTSFDKRKEDEAYTALLENSKEEMASSHQVKRFFGKPENVKSQKKSNICNFSLKITTKTNANFF